MGDYIICSFMPSWGLVRGREDELGIVILDARTTCCRPGVVFCPTNTARSLYSEEEILGMTGPEAFEACFPNPDTYQAGDSEVLVPNVVPLADFRGIVFWDDESRAYWRGEMIRAVENANPPPKMPDQNIQLSAAGPRGMWGFKFPGNWEPKVRRRERH